jgi:hypothetical protein
MWWLGHLAFGAAKITGINTIPAAMFLLVIFGAIFFGIYMIFAGTDWLNDWVAQKSLKRNNDEVKGMRDMTNLLAAQVRARTSLDRSQGHDPPTKSLGEGGLMFEEATFDNVNIT